MDITVFTEKFASCLNHTDPSQISADTDFKKLDEWSSIMALVIIAMVDSDYQKVLSAEDIRNARSISDLFTVIQSK